MAMNLGKGVVITKLWNSVSFETPLDPSVKYVSLEDVPDSSANLRLTSPGCVEALCTGAWSATESPGFFMVDYEFVCINPAPLPQGPVTTGGFGIDFMRTVASSARFIDASGNLVTGEDALLANGTSIPFPNPAPYGSTHPDSVFDPITSGSPRTVTLSAVDQVNNTQSWTPSGSLAGLGITYVNTSSIPATSKEVVWCHVPEGKYMIRSGFFSIITTAEEAGIGYITALTGNNVTTGSVNAVIHRTAESGANTLKWSLFDKGITVGPGGGKLGLCFDNLDATDDATGAAAVYASWNFSVTKTSTTSTVAIIRDWVRAREAERRKLDPHTTPVGPETMSEADIGEVARAIDDTTPFCSREEATLLRTQLDRLLDPKSYKWAAK